MLHGPTHPGVAGSELTRLLAALADHPPPERGPAFAERLGHWLSWTGAIAMSGALNAAPAVPAPPLAVATAAGTRGADDAQLARVRAALAARIDAGPSEGEPSPTDFGPYRRHCTAVQHAMHDAIAALRASLRAALRARRCPRLARLAAIDEVLDASLGGHERSLLGLVPLRLQSHFERLRHEAAAQGDTAGAWTTAFCHDMAQLLHAELAHRLLPASGLLDALRAPPTATHP